MSFRFRKAFQRPPLEVEKPPTLVESTSALVALKSRVVSVAGGAVPTGLDQEGGVEQAGDDGEWLMKRYWANYISLEIPLESNRDHLCRGTFTAIPDSQVRLSLTAASERTNIPCLALVV